MDEQTSSMFEGIRVPGFTVVRRIGIGGFATVYEAVQEDVQAPVALKVLALDHAEDRVRTRFERECRTMGTLRGERGIVPVYQAAYTADGRPVIVMALMSGGTLLDRLERQGPLPIDEVIEIGVATALALQIAHERGVHHRDVKPENILLDSDGNSGLSDFGIATIGDLSSSSRTAASLSPPHAPPERFQGRDGGDLAAGDVYSLASTLYQLLTGDPPFGTSDGGGLAALLDRVMNAPVPSIDRQDVSPELMGVLTGAMSKNPKDRPASARAFADALGRCRSNLSPTLPSAGSLSAGVQPTSEKVIRTSDSGQSASTSSTDPSSTRIIGAADLAPPPPPRPDSEPARSGGRRMYFLVLGSVVAVLLAIAALAIGRDSSSSTGEVGVEYAKLEVDVTPATAISPVALTFLWNGTPLGNMDSAAVAYCTAPWNSTSCEGRATSVLAGQEPGTWPASPRFKHRSPLIPANNEGFWQPNWLYCFAIISDGKLVDQGARLSEWACVKG